MSRRVGLLRFASPLFSRLLFADGESSFKKIPVNPSNLSSSAHSPSGDLPLHCFKSSRAAITISSASAAKRSVSPRGHPSLRRLLSPVYVISSLELSLSLSFSLVHCPFVWFSPGHPGIDLWLSFHTLGIQESRGNIFIYLVASPLRLPDACVQPVVKSCYYTSKHDPVRAYACLYKLCLDFIPLENDSAVPRPRSDDCNLWSMETSLRSLTWRGWLRRHCSFSRTTPISRAVTIYIFRIVLFSVSHSEAFL